VSYFKEKNKKLSTFIESRDPKHLLDIYTLSKLIDGEKIEIGKPLMDLSAVKNFFIERTFYLNLKNKNKDIEKNQDSKIKIKDLKNKGIIIITGEPGMGKTTILTEIGKELKRTHENNWIARINLMDSISQFCKWNETGIKITVKEALQFMFKNILLQEFNENIMEFIHIEEENNSKIFFRDSEKPTIKDANILELKLLIDLYNERKLTVLCDGFDEIAPNYAETVIEVLKIFKNIKLDFWISSRNYNIVEDLANALDTFPYTLEKFSIKDQKKFFT